MGSTILAMEPFIKGNSIKMGTFMEMGSYITLIKRFVILEGGTLILSTGLAHFITSIPSPKIPTLSQRWWKLITRISGWIIVECGHTMRESLTAIKKMALEPCTCAMEINSADASSTMQLKGMEHLHPSWQPRKYRACGRTTFLKSETHQLICI